eukprot:COSAG02_NODE_51911_length_311_cov_0.726415_1_plen_38_part_10
MLELTLTADVTVFSFVARSGLVPQVVKTDDDTATSCTF